MAKFYPLISVDKLSDGQMMSVIVAGKKIMVARYGDKYFAADDLCTHAECSLGEMGFLDGKEVTCGCHGAKFDVTNGKVLALPATSDLKTYPVVIKGEDLYIEMNI